MPRIVWTIGMTVWLTAHGLAAEGLAAEGLAGQESAWSAAAADARRAEPVAGPSARVSDASRVAPGVGAGQGAVPLPPPKQRAPAGKSASAKPHSTGHVASVVASSLAIVLGLFFCVVWLARRALPKASASLSIEVLEVLGRAPLASRHNLQLIRLGRRLLLVSVTPDHAETLTEITDPDEMNHLTSLCRQQQPGSISDSFRQVLHQLGSAPPSRQARAEIDEPALHPAADRRRV